MEMVRPGMIADWKDVVATFVAGGYGRRAEWKYAAAKTSNPRILTRPPVRWLAEFNITIGVVSSRILLSTVDIQLACCVIITPTL